jgi:hypothetical protein
MPTHRRRPQVTAAFLLHLGQVWLGIGAVTAAAFVLAGAGRVQPGAAGSWPFRLLLIPGILLIWPLVLLRWAQLERGATAPGQPPLRAQSRAALLLALAIPAILTLGLAVRQNGPFERPAVLVEAPEPPR